jgi:hypothetical protein
VEQRSPATVLADIKQLNEELGAEHHERLPYLYGAWKAKKGTYRWIAGTSRTPDPPAAPGSSPKEDGPPKNALTEAASDLVQVWQTIFKSLRSKDVQARARGKPARYWIIEDIDEFVQDFRANAAELANVPWATYDFTTMYEALEHAALIDGCMTAAKDAWEYERSRHAATNGLRKEDVNLVLSSKGWTVADPALDTTTCMWYTEETLRTTLTRMLDNLYILNGGILRKQVKGLPMGLNCAGQLANAYGYAVESRWVDTRKSNNIMSRRYIDDIFVAGEAALQPGLGLPSEDEYKMKYKLTSESPTSLIYIGVRLFVDEKGDAHTVLHDRAVDYPIQVQRYPEATTVANPAQLGGVIMGRLVAAQRTCSRLDLFQDAVAGIMTHAHSRQYPRRLMHSVWSRFLAKYWDAAAVSTKELRSWFHKAWNQVVAASNSSGHTRPQPGSGHQPGSGPRPPPPPYAQGAAPSLSQRSPFIPPAPQQKQPVPQSTAATQRPEKERLQKPPAEDDDDSPTLQLALQLSLEQQAGTCQHSTPPPGIGNTIEGDGHPAGSNTAHAQPGLSSCAASSSGAREQTCQETARTSAFPCVVDCDSPVHLPDCSTFDVGAAHGDPRITEPMCARVVLTTGPRANSPHESLSAPSTCESAMALDQPEVEPPPQHGEQHVFPPAIVVDRPVPLPYAVPMPVDRPYPVPYPVQVEKQVLVQVPVHIPVPVDRPYPVYVPVHTSMGWPLGDRTGWPHWLQNILQRLVQEIAIRPDTMVPSITALLPPPPEAEALGAEHTLILPPPPPAAASGNAPSSPLYIEGPPAAVPATRTARPSASRPPQLPPWPSRTVLSPASTPLHPPPQVKSTLRKTPRWVPFWLDGQPKPLSKTVPWRKTGAHNWQASARQRTSRRRQAHQAKAHNRYRLGLPRGHSQWQSGPRNGKTSGNGSRRTPTRAAVDAVGTRGPGSSSHEP